MVTVQRRMEKFKLETPVDFGVELSEYSTFRVGGPADALAQPRSVAELSEVLRAAHTAELPVSILGGGANIVISDAGVRGVVVYLGELQDIDAEDSLLRCGAGAPISDVAASAADRELSGLEFIYAMPGSAGGAVWMNARCYGGEIAPILHRVEYVTLRGEAGVYTPRAQDFAYKVSPFQTGDRVITAVEFALEPAPGRREAMWRRMKEIEEDRRSKGHFAHPCAGSIFKNNREFGEPSGRIIDRVGLRGLRRGGAMVSHLHGNIIVNVGGASAADIRELTREVQDRVENATGFHLEPEILFVGEWR